MVHDSGRYFEALYLILHLLLVFEAYLGVVTGYSYFEIHAKGEFGGGTILLEVGPNDTILQIKQRIEAQTGVQPCKLNLRFEGQDMMENETVGFYKIKGNSMILMRLKEPKTTTTTTTTTIDATTIDTSTTIDATTTDTSTTIDATTTDTSTTDITATPQGIQFGIYYIQLKEN